MGNVFSNIGHAITKGVTDAGHFVGKVASNPIVQTASAFIPGVGPLITAGEGALGGLLKPGGNIGSALTGGLQGAAAGALGGGIRKLGTGILTSGIGSVLGGGLKPTGTYSDANGIDGQASRGGYSDIIDYDAGGNPIYGSDIPQSIYDDPFGTGNGGSTSGGIGSDILGGLRKLGSGLSGGQNGGINVGNLALGGLAGYQALNAANASKRSGQLSDKALGLAESRYASQAPLRSAAMTHLLNPTRPDLTSVYQDVQNPFAARKLAPSAASAPAAPAALPPSLPAPGAPGAGLARIFGFQPPKPQAPPAIPLPGAPGAGMVRLLGPKGTY